MKMLKIGSDSGFHAYKSAYEYDRKRGSMTIPHAIYEVVGEFEINPEPPKNLLEELKVEVVSRALTKGVGNYIVGEAATKQRIKNEYKEGQKKWDSDHHCVMHLVGTAKTAIEMGAFIENAEGIYEVSAQVVMGLPASEYAQEEQRQKFREKLLTNSHKVKFPRDIDDARFRGRTVAITYTHIVVTSEAHAAHIILSKDEKFEPRKDKPHTSDSYIICVIGGGTLEICPIVNGKAELMHAISEPLGVNVSIDNIIKKLDKQGVYLQRRQEFERLARLAEVDRYKINRSGTTEIIDFSKVVREEMVPLARVIFQQIDSMLYKFPGVKAIEFLGGAPLVLRPYLDEENEKNLNVIYQESDKQSVFALANAYLQMLVMAENYQKLRVGATNG